MDCKKIQTHCLGKRSFKLYTKESLKIGNQFDFLVYNKWILIRRVKTLETQFHFNTILKSQATFAVKSLENLISDPNGYIEKKLTLAIPQRYDALSN